jgi:hypothetical protein
MVDRSIKWRDIQLSTYWEVARYTTKGGANCLPMLPIAFWRSLKRRIKVDISECNLYECETVMLDKKSTVEGCVIAGCTIHTR